MKTQKQLIKTIQGHASRKSVITASFLVLMGTLSYFSMLYFVFISTPGLWKFFVSTVAGVLLGVLFVIGHDLAHRALFAGKLTNDIWGRICLTFCLFPLSSWRYGHNVLHHNFTNYSPKDYVWAPLTYDQFKSKSLFSRAIYILGRLPFLHGVYWIETIWLKHMMFPSKESSQPSSLEVTIDRLVCWIYLAILLFGLACFSRTLAIDIVLIILWPFFIFSSLAGFVTYIQHTHKDLQWFNDLQNWDFYSGSIKNTRHNDLGFIFDCIFLRILQHNAHHVNPDIPLYRVYEAQVQLRTELGQDELRPVPFNLTEYVKSCLTCMLYDYDQRQWIPWAYVFR